MADEDDLHDDDHDLDDPVTQPPPVAAAAEPAPHPAIAELEGPAADLGHAVDIAGADLNDLPISQCAVDAHGRIWALSADHQRLHLMGRLVR